MTKEEILTLVKELPETVVDMPFDLDFETTVLRHRVSQKWYGVVLKAPAGRIFQNQTGSVELLNLKCDPENSTILRDLYPGILPAYHMNKRLWISVVLSMAPKKETMETLLRDSYQLTLTAADKKALRKNQI